MAEKMLGRYETKQVIGHGGMGTVYRAHDPAVDRDVALKVLTHELLANDTLRHRFHVEAQTIASLEHETIVPLYDFGESDGQPYLVMRLMAGGSLADLISAGPLPFTTSVHIIQRLARALDVVHAQGFVHRDLKPANILFDQQGQAFLSDFGLVKLLEDSASLTGSHIIGTPAYMSPEQFTQSTDIDGRSDIYALGILLYQMLTGKLPYQAAIPLAVMTMHLEAPIPSVLEERPDLPVHCDAVVAKAMAKDPEARFATAQEMVDALADSDALTLTDTLVADTLVAVEEGDSSLTVPARGRVFRISPAVAWGLISLLIVSTVALGLLLSGAINPEEPTATPTLLQSAIPAQAATESPPSPPPVTATYPPAFSEEEFGVLILLDIEQDEGERTATLLDGDLRGVLVETGLADEVATSLLPFGDNPLQQVAEGQAAKLGLLLSITGQAETLVVSASSYHPEQEQEEVSAVGKSLDSTIDALLSPFPASSYAEASKILADRIVAIVNAAVGLNSLRDGAHSECARRFTAMLSLLERINLSHSRVEASHLSLATCLGALGQLEEARKQYEQAIAINPSYSLAYYGLGNYYYSQLDYDRAQEHYESTIEHSYSDPLASDEVIGRAYAALGNIALARGEHEAAVASFDLAIDLEPDYPAYYLARALAQRAQGEEALARSDFESCVELASTAEAIQSDYYLQLQQECETLLAEEITPSAGSPVPVEAAETPLTQASIIFNAANLRSGPGTRYPILTQLLRGTTITVIARDRTGDWYNVVLSNGRHGWIARSGVERAGNAQLEDAPLASTIPAAPTFAPTATPSATPTGEAPSPITQPPTIPPPTAPPPPPPPPPPTVPPTPVPPI